MLAQCQHIMQLSTSLLFTALPLCEQVDYASDPVMLLKPQKLVIRRSFHYGIWLQHRTSAHQTQLHVMLHRLQVSSSHLVVKAHGTRSKFSAQVLVTRQWYQ